MKKFLLAIVLLMVTSTGFSQVILKRNGQTRNIVLHKNETPAAIPNSEQPLNVVYAQVNGRDTMLIVYLPEVDIDLMGRYYEIAETRQGRRLVNNVRKVYPYAKTAAGSGPAPSISLFIDRETGNTSYQLVQELRGKVRAFFYQGFARLWGYNLKSEFDPKHDKEDEQIDIIATLLERGQI